MYLNDIARAIRDEVPEDVVPEGTTLALFRLYAVLLLAKGVAVTREDVHNAWVAWMASQDADHEALVPFSELNAETQAEDSPFVTAIRGVARRVPRDP
jgi:hypothetical protein